MFALNLALNGQQTILLRAVTREVPKWNMDLRHCAPMKI